MNGRGQQSETQPHNEAEIAFADLPQSALTKGLRARPESSNADQPNTDMLPHIHPHEASLRQDPQFSWPPSNQLPEQSRWLEPDWQVSNTFLQTLDDVQPAQALSAHAHSLLPPSRLGEVGDHHPELHAGLTEAGWAGRKQLDNQAMPRIGTLDTATAMPTSALHLRAQVCKEAPARPDLDRSMQDWLNLRVVEAPHVAEAEPTGSPPPTNRDWAGQSRRHSQQPRPSLDHLPLTRSRSGKEGGLSAVGRQSGSQASSGPACKLTSPAGKESIGLLRRQASREASLQGRPSQSHLQHLGSGRIAIDLAKSLQQSSGREPTGGYTDKHSQSQAFVAVASFGSGSLAMQIAQGRGEKKPCESRDFSPRSSMGRRESHASASLSQGSLADHLCQGRMTRSCSKPSCRSPVSPNCRSCADLRPFERSGSFNSGEAFARLSQRSSSPLSQLDNSLDADPRPAHLPSSNNKEADKLRRSVRKSSSVYRTKFPDGLADKVTTGEACLSTCPEPVVPPEEPRPLQHETALLSIPESNPSGTTELMNVTRGNEALTEAPAKQPPSTDHPSEPAGRESPDTGEVKGAPDDKQPTSEELVPVPPPQPGKRRVAPVLPVSGFADEDAPGWRPPPSPPQNSNSPPRSDSPGKDDSGNSRFWTVHSLNSWAKGERRNLLQSKSSLHSKSSIQSLPSFRSWAGAHLAGESPGDLRRRKAIELRRWASRARSPSRAAKLAKANALRSVQSNLERPTQYSPHHSNSSNEGARENLPPRKRRFMDPLLSAEMLQPSGKPSKDLLAVHPLSPKLREEFDQVNEADVLETKSPVLSNKTLSGSE